MENRARNRLRPPRQDPNEDGVALIIVLMVLTLSMVLVLQLAFTSKVELRIAKNNRDEDQVYFALRAGVLQAMAQLRYDATTEGGTDTDSPSDAWASANASNSYGGVQVTVEIEDESRRFNLLHLTRLGNKAQEKKFVEKSRESMESLLADFRAGTYAEISPSVARSITKKFEDWVNRNDQHQFVPAPTESGNKILTLDELLLLADDDITPFLLYDQWDEDGEVLLPGLSRYITVWSKGKVNINTAELPVLRALFSDRNRDEAEKITEYRGDEEEDDIIDADEVDRDDEDDEENSSGLFEKTTDLTENGILEADAYNEISTVIDVKSAVFSIYATAKHDKIEKHVRVVVRRENQKLYTLLWEARPDRRIPEEGPEALENEDERFGGGFFGRISFP